MSIRNCIMVLLAMFLIMGCVGAVSADDISTVAISVTEPSTGIQPSSEVSITQGTAGSLSWSPADAPFAPGTVYTATIRVTANDGYNFTDSVDVKINDISITPTSLMNKSFTVSHTFVSTGLDTVNVTITAPRTGEPPATSATSDTTGVGTPSVSWSPNNSPFNSNINYTATIKVPAAPGYLFASSPTVKLNGNLVSGTKVEVSDNELIITYEFEATTPIEISYVALNLTPPATGNSPSDPSSITRGVGTPTVAWSPLVPTFVEGQKYYANITIPVESTNYKFTNSPTVALNGQNIPAEEFVSRTGNQIILNHSFDATALKTRIDSVTITGVTAPVYGATPVTSVTPPTGISSVTVSWNSTPATFAANTPYTATIIARTSSGYMFSTSTPSVSLNGATASTTNVTRNSDTQITITYTFPKTASATLPTAVLSTTPASGTGIVPLTVIFYYSLSNFDNCTLTYGDGTLSTLNLSGNCTHTYSSIKSYTATLTAKNVNGTTTDTKTITVKKVGLVAGFQTKPTTLSGTAPFTVKFTDSSLGTITSRTWDFGDGTIDSTTVNPTHTYDAVGSGSYKVTLTIGDGTDTDFTTKTIYVTSPVTATTTSTSSVSSLGAITLENLIIPGPFDIIKEFLNLFYTLLNSDNYLFLNNTTNTTT